ncbi:MAG: hypothetical protein JW937_09230 [Candidatus Omnitrophica bacterium]|nr:hypothetical protein [Candidatus Omnitrophota bacterium]
MSQRISRWGVWALVVLVLITGGLVLSLQQERQALRQRERWLVQVLERTRGEMGYLKEHLDALVGQMERFRSTEEESQGVIKDMVKQLGQVTEERGHLQTELSALYTEHKTLLTQHGDLRQRFASVVQEAEMMREFAQMAVQRAYTGPPVAMNSEIPGLSDEARESFNRRRRLGLLPEWLQVAPLESNEAGEEQVN